MLVARGYNFACVKRRSDCTTVPTLLSMIVGLIHLRESKIKGFTLKKKKLEIVAVRLKSQRVPNCEGMV